MASDLIFYTHPATRGRIVRWMLEEVGANYETEAIDLTDSQARQRLAAINPMAKLPAIVHRGTAITETAAICAYLADAFPEAGLAPPPAERAAYYRWLFFAAGPVEAAITNRALGVEVPPERRPMVGYGSYDRLVEVLEQAVSATPFVTGDRFTAADVYVGSQIGFGTGFGMLPERPAFTAYLARVNDRPAARRAREIDDTLLTTIPPLRG